VGERDRFLRSVRRLLGPQDHFLLGFDLVKPEAELVAAYDDRQGVSAEFNHNLLRVLNRELAADFDPNSFEHVAIWNRGASRIELLLRALRAQQVSLPGAGLEVRFEAGETVRTGISVKFSRATVEDSFAKAGFQLREWVVDERQRFAHALAAPAPG
jgi:L-histidine Nalpha-methyltransferase